MLAGLSACGGGTEAAGSATTPPVAADTAVTIQTSTTTTEPPATLVPAATDAPVTTDAPVAIEMTPELAEFAASNSAVIQDWSAQLVAFGAEAMDHLGNVSEAPASSALLDLSDQVVAAIGPETTDPGLTVARDFASGISTAITQSIDGDQEAALSTFLALQAQADELTVALDQFGS